VGRSGSAASFDRYLTGSGRADVRVDGRRQRLTPAWLARRELAALGGERKVALNAEQRQGGGART
jgi:hypothetical protein